MDVNDEVDQRITEKYFIVKKFYQTNEPFYKAIDQVTNKRHLLKKYNKVLENQNILQKIFLEILINFSFQQQNPNILKL